jgi:Zn finger protein HypA/HybF involved in hydrogenase expression
MANYFLKERAKMEISNETIIFLCPGCMKSFEFDLVGECQLVSCPLCGTKFITVQKGQTLLLEPFDFSQNENAKVQTVLR